MPVETIKYFLPDCRRGCPECGGALHEMTTETRRELIIIPAKVVVKEHISQIYSCRSCEKTGVATPIIKASLPEPVIKGSLASASSVSYIMTQKYVNAVPLYRQEQDFLRNGIALSRQTMANWVVRCSQDWLLPVYERPKEKLLAQSVLHADETVLQVLREPDKKASSNSYVWLYRTSGDADVPIVLHEPKIPKY